MKKIAILTSGGDSPAMNACIRALVLSGIKKGFDMYGVMSGYKGLINGDFIKMKREDVFDIISKAGTILKTSRCPQFKTREGLMKAAVNLKNNNIETLIVIGGDGSLRGANELREFGIDIAFLPGTIDNDLNYTDLTIGYDTACNVAMQMIDNVKDTVYSQDRIGVVEVMGAFCGDLVTNAGIACGAEVIIVPEVKTDLNDVYKKLKENAKRGIYGGIVAVNEKVMSAPELTKLIVENTGLESRAVVLGHVQRGGSPSCLDRVISTRYATETMEAISSGKKNFAICYRKGEFYPIPMMDVFKGDRQFDSKLYSIVNDLT